MSVFVVSAHAVDRYCNRVHAVPPALARNAIEDLLSDARIRPTPRHWMRQGTHYGDGVRFAYSPRAPHTALVLRGSTVVTVLTRALYRSAHADLNRPERRYERKPRAVRHTQRRLRARGHVPHSRKR